MLKKILVGAAVLGLTAAALANGNGVSTIAAPVSDFDPGFVIGLQAGLGSAGWYRLKDSEKIENDNSLAGRLYVGYDFTKNWGAELGYVYFGSKTTIKSNDGNNTQYSDIRTQIIDLVGVGTIPIVDSFDIYGKAGLAYLMSKGIKSGGNNSVGDNDKQNNVGVALGIGADYYFTDNIWMDLSWTTYLTGKKFGKYGSTTSVGNYQPDANFYAIGIGYDF